MGEEENEGAREWMTIVKDGWRRIRARTALSKPNDPRLDIDNERGIRRKTSDVKPTLINEQKAET